MSKKLIAFLLLAASSAFAQQAGSPFSGFSANKDKPINFEADRAEVYDTEKKAILIGNVRVVQGESVLTAKKLVLWYESAEETKKTSQKAAGAGAEGQSVKKIDMEGDVVVTSKNQRATSNFGVYDAKGDLATLTGNVILTQCKSVMTGEKLVVDLKTNIAKLDPNKGGRVSGVLVQTKDNDPDCPKPTATPTTAPPLTAPKPVAPAPTPKRG